MSELRATDETFDQLLAEPGFRLFISTRANGGERVFADQPLISGLFECPFNGDRCVASSCLPAGVGVKPLGQVEGLQITDMNLPATVAEALQEEFVMLDRLGSQCRSAWSRKKSQTTAAIWALPAGTTPPSSAINRQKALYASCSWSLPLSADNDPIASIAQDA
jgi:hypothetical protein